MLNTAWTGVLLALAACKSASLPDAPQSPAQPSALEARAVPASRNDIPDVAVDPASWPALKVPPLDPTIEARVDGILSRMTTEQKVGQVIQADSDAVTPEEVKRYRLGSVLSGGNSAPGDKAWAGAGAWLADADAYYLASVDPEGVEVAIPVIWGIDAVHGHANLTGATIFPHNIALGAANDPDLIEAIARATAIELTVSGHDWTFAPTLAVPQDDRWGRTYEGFSEDPAIVSRFAERIVWGLQGRPGQPDFMGAGRVISSAKHFAGDGATENGVDQGDARITEAAMRDTHAAGYVPAIEAGVQTVMASFSSWNGIKIHGSEALLTDVLKDRMGFTGFVIGDWNGHGQVPNCTNTDCPRSLLAGVDMYMAPDSWEELYESTLRAVRSGEIPMARLDDAVRRILRVKIASGIFEKGAPSTRPNAGDVSLLASPEHRALARRAVRQSLVLLKNDNGVLPLDPGLDILVVGPGADSIAKSAGGWTLSWQGGVDDNAEFPNGQSILDGIREIVGARGGRVIYNPAGDASVDADVVIAVFGENPYAEFQGDREHLDFEPNDFDTTRLRELGKDGRPVVSVFLSGRPLWVNPELNASDAFVAAWLPGSEGGGVADMLFATVPDADFSGRLSFSWPARATDVRNNAGQDGYAPLFPLGYGRGYADTAPLAALSEESGIDPSRVRERGVVFVKGGNAAPWRAYLVSPSGVASLMNGVSASTKGLNASRASYQAQDDGLSLTWQEDGAALAFQIEGETLDWSREANGALELSFAARVEAPTDVEIGMACEIGADCGAKIALTLPAGEWQRSRISLSCFQPGVNFANLAGAITLSAKAGDRIAFADLRLVQDDNGKADCGS
jgi:beta-glucosidase